MCVCVCVNSKQPGLRRNPPKVNVCLPCQAHWGDHQPRKPGTIFVFNSWLGDSHVTHQDFKSTRGLASTSPSCGPRILSPSPTLIPCPILPAPWSHEGPHSIQLSHFCFCELSCISSTFSLCYSLPTQHFQMTLIVTLPDLEVPSCSDLDEVKVWKTLSKH